MESEDDRLEKDLPIWDISFEELREAYKRTAMKRHLPWDTDKIQEERKCLPLHKIFNKRGNFPRRITWLYMYHGTYYFCQFYLSFLSNSIILI